jgi:hypothetical protein
VERGILLALLEQHRTEYEAAPDEANQLESVGLAKPRAEVDPIDLASWTAVARAILNLNETITRN